MLKTLKESRMFSLINNNTVYEPKQRVLSQVKSILAESTIFTNNYNEKIIIAEYKNI